MLDNIRLHVNQFFNGNGAINSFGDMYGGGSGSGKGYINVRGYSYNKKDILVNRSPNEYPFYLIQYWSL